eukprot:TRINITY_DN320_c0_g1_i1.p1 TRINITY_DN320_c0_g1~~TRINITY_DN320_c0_g1_i1.p1  ORF type:complete len:395 (-),score=84.51 TRINITY_DN320_c0_g1_i1:1-1185(-)
MGLDMDRLAGDSADEVETASAGRRRGDGAAVREDSISLLGQKLLLGWTMLGSHCPQCQIVPLMQEPQDGRIYCVNCEMWCATESEIASSSALSSPSTSSPPSRPSDGQQQQQRQQQQQQQQRLQNRPSSSLVAGGAGRHHSATNGVITTPSSSTPTPSNTNTASASPNTTSAATQTDNRGTEYDDDFVLSLRRRREADDSDRGSRLLGEKLLQGWTMCSNHCSECLSPFMKRRGAQEEECVVCEPPAIQSSVVSPPTLTSQEEGDGTGLTSGEKRTHHVAFEATSTSAQTASRSTPTSSSGTRTTTTTLPSPTQSSSRSSSSSSSIDNRHLPTFNTTLDQLFRTMEQAESILSSANNSDSAGSSEYRSSVVDACSIIKEVSATLDGLYRLRNRS